MKDMKHIGTMGHLLKKEDLATFESTISFDQLILESQMPFPGYYELFKAPNVRELEHNCLMPVLKTQRQICEDDAIRSIMHVKRKHPDVEFDAVLGHVMLQNEKRTVFRIKIKEIDNLKIILKAFEDEGYVFEKHKKVRPYSSLIEIRKFFQLEEIAENLYKDEVEAHHYYCRMERELAWDEFEAITKLVKTNCEYSFFDAALSYVIVSTGIVDLIRIYTKDATLNQLLKVRDRYCKDIKNFDLGKKLS